MRPDIVEVEIRMFFLIFKNQSRREQAVPYGIVPDCKLAQFPSRPCGPFSVFAIRLDDLCGYCLLGLHFVVLQIGDFHL